MIYSKTKRTYRYGFNGKENDNEVKGIGNQVDYGMRVYDSRIGRFMSLDPLQTDYPMLTPYQYAFNSPVAGVDLDGKEFNWFMAEWAEKKMFGTSHLQKIREGFTERAVKSVRDLYNFATKTRPSGPIYGSPFTTLTAGIRPGMKLHLNPEVELAKQGIKNAANEYGQLLHKALNGDEKAIGALGFEAVMLVLTGG